jgi:hypothetical protein
VPEADEPEDGGDVDAGDEGEHAGVAAQIVAELTECAESFFGLGDKVGITFEGAEAHRVVDMFDGDAVLAESLAEQDILVAIMTEPFIEGITEHEVATHQEIGGMEMLPGILLTFRGCMLGGLGTLVEVTEIAGED